jgi:hypothetical protein
MYTGERSPRGAMIYKRAVQGQWHASGSNEATKTTSEIRSNCTRTLKNLSTDAVEAIEEGTVAALIAMSLEVRL